MSRYLWASSPLLLFVLMPILLAWLRRLNDPESHINGGYRARVQLLKLDPMAPRPAFWRRVLELLGSVQ